MVFDSTLLLLAILIPLFGGLTLLGFRNLSASVVRLVALTGFTLPLLIAIWLYFMFAGADQVDGYRFFTELDTGLGFFGINLTLGLNGISLPLFFLAGLVGLAAGIQALHSDAGRRQLYLSLLLIMQAGLMGTFASVDIFFFYFFHELALIPTFVMIGIWGGFGRRSAAIEMTIYLTLGAMLSLLGLILIYSASGIDSFNLIDIRQYLIEQPLSETLSNNIFGLLLFGFGILVSLFPFHSWAPRGYAAAPTAAAMLHAGVLKKFGLYGLIQIAYPLLPQGAAHWGPLLMWLALGNVVVIGLITMAQRDLKQMVGYSSVMHMGYCFLGLVTLNSIGVGGAVILMFGHGLSVALLFMLSTAVFHRTQTYDMKEMGGLATRTPILAGMFVAATFASIGLPGFANFWGEFAIFVSLWHYNPWALAAAATGIIISAIYGLRAVAWIFFGKPSEALAEHWKENKPFELRQGERLSATLLFSGLMIVGFFPRIFSDYVDMDLTPYFSSEPTASVQAASPAEIAAQQNDSEMFVANATSNDLSAKVEVAR
ncbi:complex I subunit 4 family protein [Puniceicoccus vermicola]|uniref:NADH-quinone oxidoreductase subunit M n=1 Tax=Puniceicoccus vermicola TaxID=388746 RepID=A0A7X1AVJ2_9BACT|nr:NADH-quinone oxidoreductase subunit M [Puniceicoccus vermicola]MBC2600775.1 NADH-quinone oxidoreductase subunit M [Puniceicoccus vermicola]